MPTPEPLDFGHYYHIYNRGNNRENLFVEARNYRLFLELYAKHVLPVADTYAYVMLKNHFHFLVRTRTVEEQATWRASRGRDVTGGKSVHLSRRSAMIGGETNAQQAPAGHIEVAFKPLDPSKQVSN